MTDRTKIILMNIVFFIVWVASIVYSSRYPL